MGTNKEGWQILLISSNIFQVLFVQTDESVANLPIHITARNLRAFCWS